MCTHFKIAPRASVILNTSDSFIVCLTTKQAIAHAVTHRKLRFDICLFGCQSKLNNERESKTIVEIQRMTSYQVGFDKIVNTIFLAANGDSYDAPDVNETFNVINLSLIAKRLSTSKLDEEKIGSEQLNRIGELLSQKEFDSNKLGMESMVSLTNRRNTSERIVTLVANFLLFGNDHDFGGLRSKIYNLIVYGRMILENVETENENESFIETHYSNMRSDALQVHLNLFETATATSSRLKIHDIISTKWFEDEFIHALFNTIRLSKMVPHSAHDAYTIMKCLNLIRCNSLLGCRLKGMMSPLMQSTIESSALQGYHDLLAIELKNFMSSTTTEPKSGNTK